MSIYITNLIAKKVNSNRRNYNGFKRIYWHKRFQKEYGLNFEFEIHQP